MSNLIITGVIDGSLPGGLPKAIELYVVNDIADLSAYGIGSANNGGGSDGEELTLTGSAVAGEYLYIASEAPQFTAFFGFAPDFTSAAASINGDDAIELFENGAVVDVFGDINTDGTGDPWEYQDGWAARKAGTGPDGSSFALANWEFSGPNLLDGASSNADAELPFPLASYDGDGTSAPSFAINEFRISSPGSADDSSNFIEIITAPGTDFSNLTLLSLSSEFAPGAIDAAISLDGGVADSDGVLLIANSENPA
ncbi:MAG: hypothetical protein OIF40_09870, partial [Mangrovicoccus sp.]|nr:hypothetical protein [Mangrovicoccus sp.]